MSDDLLVTLGVKDKGATTKIKELKKEIKSLDNEYKIASKSSNTFESSTDKLKNKLTYLNNKYDATKAKLEAYKEKLADTTAKMKKKKEELELLKNSEENNTKAIQKAEKQLSTYQTQMNEAKRNINLTDTELKSLKNEIIATNTALNNQALEQYKERMSTLGTQIETTGNRIKTIGSVASTTGNALIGLSTPIVAFGAYATKVSIDYEKAMSTVKGTSQASESQIGALSKKAKQLGEDIRGAGATDVANSFNYLALAGYDVNQMLEAIEPNVKASLAFNADMATTTDLVTDSLSALGKGAEYTQTYLDALSLAQSKCNSTGTQLLEAYVGCGGMFRDWNTPLAESTALLGILANRGIKGSEAGTSMNSILVNLIGTTERTSAALEIMGVSAYDSEGNFRGVETILKECAKSMNNMTDAQQDSISAALGGKTQMDTFKALIAGIGDEYDALKTNIENSDGALENMYETMTDNTKGAYDDFQSKLETLGLTFGEKILPHINNLLNKGIELIEWFGSLSDETQESILKFGLFTLATGGALKVIGGFGKGIGDAVIGVGKFAKYLANASKGAKAATTVTEGVSTAISTVGSVAGSSSISVGAIVKGFGSLAIGAAPVVAGLTAVAGAAYVMHENNELLNKSCATTTEELSGVQKVLNHLHGDTIKSKEEMQQLGLAYDDFNGNVSKDFQTEVNQMAYEVKEFGSVVEEINIDGICTEEEANALKMRISNLSESATKSVQEAKQNIDKVFEKGSNPDGSLTTNESYVYQILVGDKEETLQKITNVTNEMTKYIDDCVNKNITPDKNKIESYYAQLGQYQLEAQAQNQDEIIASQRNFAEQLKSMNIEDAAKLLTEKKKSYKEELVALQENNNARIKEIKIGLMNCDAAQKPYIEAELKSLKDKNKQILDDENNKWKTQLDYIESFSPELLNNINILNGKMLTDQEKMSVDSLNKMKEHYEGLSEVTESGCYTLYNTQDETWESVAVTVDEATGRISAAVSENGADYGAYSDKVEGEARNLMATFQEKKEAIISYLGEMGYSYDATSNQIVDANGRAIGSIDQLKQNENGLYQTTLTVNGTPVNIVVNKDGTISSCNEINNALDNASRDRSCTIFVSTKGTPFDTSMNSNDRNWNWGNPNYSPLGKYASGTKSAKRGYALVGEEGPEIVFMNGGETVLTADETNKLITGGGYFNPNTSESSNLINNVYNTNSTQIYNNTNNDLIELANMIVNGIKGIQFNLSSDKNINISKTLGMKSRRVR